MPRLIDADKMIKDIKENYVIYGYADFLNDFFRMVEEQPTVDAEPVRHGRWVHNKWSNMRHDYSCSLCGCRIEGVDPFSLSATTYNYCPECGAVMDGVEE